MSLGERILELRKQQNISQTDLASAMGVSRQAVSKWESDKSSPDTVKLIQLSEVLDTEVEYLATGRHPVYQSPPINVTLLKKVDKVVEKVVEKPVDHFIEKPVIKRVVRVHYKQDPLMLGITAVVSLVVGLLIGLLF